MDAAVPNVPTLQLRAERLHQSSAPRVPMDALVGPSQARCNDQSCTEACSTTIMISLRRANPGFHGGSY
jgi:hypothetical protein